MKAILSWLQLPLQIAVGFGLSKPLAELVVSVLHAIEKLFS
jgi:hypothetical protein